MCVCVCFKKTPDRPWQGRRVYFLNWTVRGLPHAWEVCERGSVSLWNGWGVDLTPVLGLTRWSVQWTVTVQRTVFHGNYSRQIALCMGVCSHFFTSNCRGFFRAPLRIAMNLRSSVPHWIVEIIRYPSAGLWICWGSASPPWAKTYPSTASTASRPQNQVNVCCEASAVV